MSQRHRTADAPVPPKKEVSAHKHSERQRIQPELKTLANQVSAGIDPEDVHEPGAAWKPSHHHDAEVAKTQASQAQPRPEALEDEDVEASHAMRQARAEAFRMAGEG